MKTMEKRIGGAVKKLAVGLFLLGLPFDIGLSIASAGPVIPRDGFEYEELYKLQTRIKAVVRNIEGRQAQLLDVPNDAAKALLLEQLSDRPDLRAWRFVKVEKNPFNKEDELSPKALYSVDMGALEERGISGTGYTYGELKPVLDHYGLRRPSELEGRVILGSKQDPFDALNYLIRGEAEYLVLIGEDGQQKFIFGPYAEPFECVETK